MPNPNLTRRGWLRGAITAAASPIFAFAQERPSSALALARILNRTTFGELPPVTVKHAKMILASTMASAASGARIGSASIIRDLAKEQGGKAEAPIWFDGAKLPVNQASRVNAMLSDAAASDDSDLRNVAHIGTCLTAVGLALSERMGAAGQDLLCAMVTGYEAAGRISEAVGRPGEALSGSWGTGFHASVIVAFGGVAAAGKLLRLSHEQMAHAIGLTATTMGGLAIGTNSWAREYHAGNAAQCAVYAALAAGRGYTVNEDMLEARGGFLSVFNGHKPETQSLTREIGNQWQIARFLAIKLVPGAHAFEPAVEAAIKAAQESRAAPEEVAKILVSGPQIRTIANNRPPEDMIEAIHSLPYFLASAVADKDFSWVHTTPEKIHRPEVARLIGLVEVDAAPQPVRYEWSWGATVTLITRSGARFTSTMDAPKGSAPRGIEWSEVDAKYRALMPESRLPAKRIEEALKVIHDFERVKKVTELTDLLS
jgi:2-methylcitrate dehydratase PrpD